MTRFGWETDPTWT